MKISKQKLLEDLFRAYFNARKNKRSTANVIKFEMNYEQNLIALRDDIWNREYEIGKSICFISFFPVKREIFAGDFCDRVVHHLIFNYLNPFCERLFINDSYSCRKDRGTSMGIRRLIHFIRSCSQNYSRECYILKLDISGYFMSIDKNILFAKIKKIIARFEKKGFDFDVVLLLWLVRKVIFHNATKNCIIKGGKIDWNGLPKTKSLFYAEENKGLPIGNLTSQLFGNIYLNDFDHFVMCDLRCKRYGRYVDDFFIVHKNKEYLKSIIPKIRGFLWRQELLELHPNKIYLQYFNNGIDFLGVFIKPYRVYIRNRIKGSIFKVLIQFNKAKIEHKSNFLPSLNSYFGILNGCRSYNLQKKLISHECKK